MIATWFLVFLVFLAGYGLATVIFLIARLIEHHKELKALRKSCKEMALDSMEAK